MLAIRYRVEPVDVAIRVVVQSELVTNEETPKQSDDPRVTAVIENALEPVLHGCRDMRAMLVHRTRSSKLQMAAAMDHRIDASGRYTTEIESQDSWARLTVSTGLDRGEHLQLDKFVTYGWSRRRSVPALSDQVSAALTSVLDVGWAGAATEQADAYRDYWDGADVEIDGPVELQLAVRLGMFHVFQASARAEQRAIPAKGLTGTGYDGHAFWDTESFVLPLLSATAPHAAADALRWRHATLELARERARTLRLAGAAFPWRTIRGEECSAYWPAGTAAFHVNADIAVAAARHYWWTHDDDLARDCGLDIVVETARLWAALGYRGEDGRFHIDGVTGPDEYSALSDDNVYTNLMAATNLRAAVAAVTRFPDQAAALSVAAGETSDWTWAADHMAVPYSDEHEVHEQSRGFTVCEVWDFERSARDGEYPLLLHVPYFDLYRTQVVKQADLLLAMHWAGDEFSAAEKARAVAYYEPLTVRDSSLSACTQAVLAAEVGHLDLAADYLAEAALMDLRDTEHNAKDGLHLASLAGAWLAVVAGFGGLRDSMERPLFRPQLPPGWGSLRFRVRWRGQRLHVDIDQRHVTYSVHGERPVEIRHCSRDRHEDLTVRPGKPVRRRWAAVKPSTPRPTQPPGREPRTVL